MNARAKLLDWARTRPGESVKAAQERRLSKAWETPKGWRYWSAVNNTEVGLWYTICAFVFFLFAGVLALIMRAQLAVPDNDLVTADQYNQIFTLHGSVMMFLFGVPSFEAFSILVLPQMLGARDLPFPRLSAFGFWCFLIGGVFVCGSLFFGIAPKGGWFMYPPLTTEYQDGYGADIWLLGLSFIEIASIAAAVELIVGALKTRPPGMRINLMPLYAWYVLVVAGMILFAFPPLIAGDLLFEMQRAFDWPFFDPDRGGDPLLWQHLFWIFGHPEVYIIFLPAIALVATMIPTFAGRPLVGYSWVVLAAVGTGFISFGLWVHHMYATGLPNVSLGFFSAASVSVAIPTGVQIFCFIATMLVGRATTNVPLLYVSGAFAVFVLGGLTGVMVALVPFDLQVHDTYFIVAHLHYVLVGGVVFPILGAIHYFFPLVNGKSLSPRLGTIAFWLAFVGFNLAFWPMHISGLRGMPRRVFTYEAGMGLELLNMISTIGAFTLAAGLAVFLWDVVRPKSRQPLSPRNPWNAGTIEWAAKIPPEPWGARTIPAVSSRYPLWDQENFLDDYDHGRFYLPDAEEVKRETIITTVIDAVPIQCLRVPGPTWLTLIAAAGAGGLFVLATFKLYVLALLCGAIGFATILIWLWTGTALEPEKEEKDIGLGVTVPLYASGPASVGWWAMFITMIGDATAFAGLVFGYYFFWTVHPQFPPAGADGPGTFWPLVSLGLLALAWAATLAARGLIRREHRGGGIAALALGALSTIAGVAALAAGPWLTGMDPTVHAYEATVWVLVLWTGIHGAIGLVMQLYCIARAAAGRLTARRDIDIANVALYWHFMLATIAVTVATIAGFPLLS
ncbi:cytochrome c oxidase subunit I [Salinarimonas ramus]|uniref:cytochrome-c oxidase n=1 Tax=Salinarimonas ramus TaxID=690164 RepID=A0A917Q4M6_9HYPH|nr:cytochrome c oxidase subunit I [Salinarimonas ramus]GGK21145.1 cytochrome c oxidase subunit I [Salinarimonas ramus]